MESSKLLIILLVLTATTITLFATPTREALRLNGDEDSIYHFHAPKGEDASSLRRSGRFLAQKPRSVMTFDQYPRACAAKGSAGPDCCRKQCVNVMTDSLNCGKCGKKCKYSEICCQGWCVNPTVDEKHCGRCNNRCKKGSSCAYDLCSYSN
ncbi:unnamed protein product [Ilex paraguariensis]|uniref:Stigma-specific STIG1-like protein 1 n=1 Tax=Ilex paraguariensis TaxID=185542 RepID=A0ABC8QZY0_9AQUA